MARVIAEYEGREHRGVAFKHKHLAAARELIDEGVAEVLAQFGDNPMSWECERLLRMGATGTNGRRTTPDDAFRRLDVDKKDFRKELRDHQLPPPSKLLAWGQLLSVAAGWLDPRSTSSRDETALSFGFSDGGSCSTRCHHHSGLYPSDVTSMAQFVGALMECWLRDKRRRSNGRRRP